MQATADVELVDLAANGSEAAYRELLRRYQKPVFSLILRMVRDRGTAEDLAQEAFVRAFRALDRFDRSRKFSSWLFKISHNLTIDHLRRKRLQTDSLDEPGRTGDFTLASRIADPRAPPPARRVEQSDLAEALERAVGALRDDYREVILLRFSQDLSYQEIAEILQLPLGTVKTNIHRARKEMAELLRAEGFEP